MVTYDFGVMGEFEHTPPITLENPNPKVELVTYIGECKEILKLYYGLTKVIMLLCFWVSTGTHGANVSTKRDNLGSLSSTLGGYFQLGNNLLYSFHKYKFFLTTPLKNLDGKLFYMQQPYLEKWLESTLWMHNQQIPLQM